VRPTPLLLAALILPVTLFLSGCSNRVERIVGNERLIRGPGGLGTTLVQGPAVDRDTYVTPGTANFGTSLLVGRTSTYEAHAFFKFASFSLPDTTRAGFTPGEVLFELAQDTLRRSPLKLDLDLGVTNAAIPDSAVLGWPGPTVGTSLGSITFDFGGPILISLGPGSFSEYKQWALNPGSVPGFILRATLVQGVAGFRAGAARFRVPYSWDNGGTTVFDTTNTTVTFDAYVHPPISPTPTGSDTALVLGGGFEAGLAIHAPVGAVAPGASVNQLRLVLAVIDSLQGVDGSTLKNTSGNDRVSVTLEVYRITGAWPEGAVDLSSIPHDAAATTLVLSVASGPGDSLSIPLPTTLARGWAENPASNEGVLVLVRTANVNPGVVVGSRESSRPPVLRVSTTSPPPGRF